MPDYKPNDPEAEACRIVIMLMDRKGTVNVAAPMKHKPLCYDILRDAKTVLDSTDSAHFFAGAGPGTRVIIVMRMSGRVDLAAPFPDRALCDLMLKNARSVIERYDDAEAPPMRAFSDKMLGN